MPIKLVDSMGVIQSRINAACAEELNNILPRHRYKIMSAMRSLAGAWIMMQPEMDSLAGGLLAGMFGLYQGTEAMVVDSIRDSVMGAISVNFKTINNTLSKGGISINFQPATFANLLSLPTGHTVYEGGDLHWLQWLLERGDSMIVVDYHYSPASGMGRSGQGYMKKTGMFRVPPQFSGTLNDNFVTRALVGPAQEKEINRQIAMILR